MLAKPMIDAPPWQYVQVQPKLDGVRAVWLDGHLWSRHGKRIDSLPELTEHLRRCAPDTAMDGELYAHGIGFQRCVSIVKRGSPHPDASAIRFHAFDFINTPGIASRTPFKDRAIGFLSWYDECVTNGIPTNLVEIVPTHWCEPKDIGQWLDRYSTQGYEGVIVRNPNGVYETKRSSNMLKVKRFDDGEFVVVGVEPLETKEKIALGGWEPGAKQYASGAYYRDGESTRLPAVGCLVCQTASGERFGVGTGLDDQTRESFWTEPPIGKVCTIKHQGFSDSGVPRFPVFVAIRDYE